MHRQYNISANYRDGKWTIQQQLGTVSLYSLDGDFDKAIAYLARERASYYESYMTGPCKVSEICGNKSVWNPPLKEVTFSELKLDWGQNYDGDKELRVIGVREPIAEELEFLDNYRKEQDSQAAAYRRQQFENLKKEFGET